jgi:hypothetical protein
MTLPTVEEMCIFSVISFDKYLFEIRIDREIDSYCTKSIDFVILLQNNLIFFPN